MTKALRREVVAEAKKVAGEDRVRTFVVSTGGVDRYNTIIDPKGGDFSNFRKLPTVLVQHGYAFDGMPVAKARNVRVDGDQVLADLEFLPVTAAPEADRMLALVDAGVLATSIRMDPTEVEYDASRETGDAMQDWWSPPLNYRKWELLEISLVNVPGNADALLKRSSTLPEDQLRALNVVMTRALELGDAPKPPLTRDELDKLKSAAKRSAPVEAPATTEPPPAPVEEQLPENFAAIADEVIARVVEEERAALEAKRAGNTSRTTKEHAP